MVNWYFPLYLGIIFILYLFAHVASHASKKDYLLGNKGLLGLSLGTNSFLLHLVSGEAILLSIMAVVSFGVLGGVGFALVELISLTLFAMITNAVRKAQLCEESILAVWQKKLNRTEYQLSLLILGICALASMILQGLVLKHLLGSVLAYSFPLALFFMAVFSWVWSGLGGFGALSQGAKILVTFIFFTTALLTVSIFLEKGIRSTYEDLITFSYRVVDLKIVSFLLPLAIIVRLSQRLLDNYLWHLGYHTKIRRLPAALSLAILCYLAIPLAFSALTVFALSQGIDYYQGNIIVVLRNLNFSFLLNLYLTTVFLAVTSTYAVNLYGLTTIYLTWQKKAGPIRNVYLFALLMILFSLGTIMLLRDYPLTRYLVFLALIYLTFFLGLVIKSVQDFIKTG